MEGNISSIDLGIGTPKIEIVWIFQQKMLAIAFKAKQALNYLF